jgi:hypothetical protein
VQPDNANELVSWMRQNLTLPFVVKGGGHSYACQSVQKMMVCLSTPGG